MDYHRDKVFILTLSEMSLKTIYTTISLLIIGIVMSVASFSLAALPNDFSYNGTTPGGCGKPSRMRGNGNAIHSAYLFSQHPTCRSEVSPEVATIGSALYPALNCVNGRRRTERNTDRTDEGFYASCTIGPACKKNNKIDIAFGEICDPTASQSSQTCSGSCQWLTQQKQCDGTFDSTRFQQNTPGGKNTFTQQGGINNSRSPATKNRQYNASVGECHFVCKDIQTYTNGSCQCPTGTERSNATQTCQSPTCDGVSIQIGEQCDDTILPNAHSDTSQYSCNNSCKLIYERDCPVSEKAPFSEYILPTYPAQCLTSSGIGTGLICTSWSQPIIDYNTAGQQGACYFDCRDGYERNDTTEACERVYDTTPNDITIEPTNNAQCGEWIFSDPIVVNGIDTTIDMDINPGTEAFYTKNLEPTLNNQIYRNGLNTLPVGVDNNDEIYLIIRAANVEGGSTTTNLSLGDYNTSREIESSNDCRDRSPADFDFRAINDRPRDETAVCEAVDIQGLTPDVDIEVMITGGAYRINPPNDDMHCYDDTPNDGEKIVLNLSDITVEPDELIDIEITILNTSSDKKPSDLDRLITYRGSIEITLEERNDDDDERVEADEADYNLPDDDEDFRNDDAGRKLILEAISFDEEGRYRLTATDKADDTRYGTVIIEVDETYTPASDRANNERQRGSGTIQNDDSIEVCLRSSDEYYTRKSSILTIGDKSNACRVRTLHDQNPDDAIFYRVRDAPLDTDIESNEYTVSGITDTVEFSVKNGRFKINDGTYTTRDATVSSGDVIRLKTTSLNDYDDMEKVTFELGNIAGEWRVTTRDISDTTINVPNTGYNAPTPTTGGHACLERYNRYFTSDRTFSDIKGHRYQSSIEYMHHYYILRGNGKDKYFPDNFTRMYELVVIMVNAHDAYLCRELIHNQKATSTHFKDLPTSHPTTEHFNRAMELGLLDGLITIKDGEKYINPNRFVSINDIRKIAANTIKVAPAVINTRNYNRLGQVGTTLRRGEVADIAMNLYFSERGLNQP